MKLHYVYYAIKEDGTLKVGATSQPKTRAKKYSQFNILEQYDCPWKCGDREIELQIEKFGKRDSAIHYAQTLKNTINSWKNPNRKGHGCTNGNSKLSEKDIRYIRKIYFKRLNQMTPIPKGMKSSKDLSIQFQVSEETIRNIYCRRTYTSVK